MIDIACIFKKYTALRPTYREKYIKAHQTQTAEKTNKKVLKGIRKILYITHWEAIR